MPLTLPVKSVYRILALAVVMLFAAPLHAKQYETNGHTFSVSPLPAWVDWVELPAKSGQRPGQAVAYRLVDRQVRLAESTEIRFKRLVTQPLSEAGLHAAAELDIEFNPAFQKLVIHTLGLHRNGKTIDKLAPEQIRLIQREQDYENKLYDGIVTAVIIVDDVRVGDSVDLAYSIEGRNPVFGNKHFSAFAMGWNVPVDLARVRLSTPAGRKVYTQSFNGKITPDVRKVKGRTEYQWSRWDTPAIISEDNAPVWYQPYPGIQITEYRRWRDVSTWADNLYTHNNALPPQLNETLQRWRNEEKDPKQLAARALRLVQNEVRYFGIELGQNSHRPSLPSDVYERRYGDCKDKTSLLIAMLEQLGIKANPALVSTSFQRDIDNWLPSPGLFDHVIVTTELDGKRYWLDGTRNYQQGSIDTLGIPDYERALIVRKGENRLTPIEVTASAVSGIDIREEFRITKYDSPVTLDVKTTYSGAQAEAMREFFATNAHDAITRTYTNYYAKIYPSIKAIEQVGTLNDPVDNRFTTLERYHVDNFWEADEKSGSHAYLIGSTIAPYIKKPDSIRRSSPLAITHPVSIRHQSTLIYPEDIEYSIAEPEIVVEDRMVSYRRAVSYDNRKLTVTHDYSSREDAIMPAGLDDYFSNLNKIKTNLSYSTWISDTAGPSHVETMVNTLLDQLDTFENH